MSIKLQLRRGLETDLPTLAVGEPGFCTDSYKMFIGSAAGNKGIAMLASPIFTGLITIPNTASAVVGPIRNARAILIHDFQHPTGGGAIPAGYNIFVGGAGNFTMGTTATEIYHGSYNVGIGPFVLLDNTTGYNNFAGGYVALQSNTVGYENTAVGAYTLVYNIGGHGNTAVGMSVLLQNISGNGNSALGANALSSNTIGYNNSSMGLNALSVNTEGYDNCVMGANALASNNVGYGNTAIGTYALNHNISGANNVAIGYLAGYYETASNKLFIDNAERASEADGRLKALIYGVFAATTAAQLLWINGRFGVLLSEVLAAANDAAAASAGVLVGQFYRTNADPSVLCIRSA